MIFLTGANGLIGSFIARKLLADGQAIRALRRPDSDLSLLGEDQNRIEWVEGDVLDILSLERAVEGCTEVVHTAAIVSFSPKERRQLYQVNVEGTANVVNVSLAAGVRKLVHISSVAALGRPEKNSRNAEQPVEIDEEQKWEESPQNSHYAKSKYQAELEVWRGIAEGLPAVIVNPSVVLGEGDWSRSSTALFKYVFDEKPFYTEGTLNYVDVRDVAEAVSRLLVSDIVNERFILNGGKTTYRQFFALAAEQLGKKAPRFRVTPLMAAIAWRVEAIRGFLTGKKPLVTRETARSSLHHFYYHNEKIQGQTGLKFHSLEETTARIAAAFLRRSEQIPAGR
jgi:dihydroflavonol-4-reductase